MTRVDQISNGNEKLSSRELMYLNRLAKNKEFVKRFSKFDLRKIKKNLQKQLSAYLRRRDIKNAQKRYIRELTYRAVININKLIRKSNTENKEYKSLDIDSLEKQFPTINNVSKLIRSIRYMKSTRMLIRRKIKEIAKNHYSDNAYVTLRYYGIVDKVKVKDLKGLLKAVNYLIKVGETGVIYSKNGNINYKKMRELTKKELEKKEVRGIKKIVVLAHYYVGMSGINSNLRREILKYAGLDPSKEQWCAAWVRTILKKAGYKNAAERMTNTALSALGINKAGWHIGIYIGHGIMIDGNTGGRRYSKVHGIVRKESIYRAYRKKGFVGWIMPEDVGNIKKVHLSFPPLPGALVVFGRGSNYMYDALKARRWLKRKRSLRV